MKKPLRLRDLIGDEEEIAAWKASIRTDKYGLQSLRVGQQWITRAARDQETHRIVGECFGVGTFLLDEDGCRLSEWIHRS